MRTANLGLRFALELGALAALAAWGAQTGLPWLFAVGAPVAAAVVWGALVSPKAAIDAPRAVRLFAEAAVFGAAALALASAGGTALGAAFALVALASGAFHHSGRGGPSPWEAATMRGHRRGRP